MDDSQMSPVKVRKLNEELVRAWEASSVELPAEDYSRLVLQAGVVAAVPAKDLRNGYFKLSGDNYLRLVNKATASLRRKVTN